MKTTFFRMENNHFFELKIGSHKLEGIAFVLTNVLTENEKPLKINDLKGFFTWYLQKLTLLILLNSNKLK